jgi:hypothetical protein
MAMIAVSKLGGVISVCNTASQCVGPTSVTSFRSRGCSC